jgi:transcriptional regulator with XRE-family HTH domain
MTRRGVAYRLWQAVEDYRLNRSWTKVRMAEHLGLPRNTIDRLETSPRPPQVATVHTIADAIGVDRRDAEIKGGLRAPAPDGAVSVREAILADPHYTEQQRATMLALVDLIEQSNADRNGERRAAG